MAAACPVPPASQTQPWLDPAYSPECQAQFVVQAIPSISDKVAALTSNTAFPNMGIVLATGGDGPAGDVTGNGSPSRRLRSGSVPHEAARWRRRTATNSARRPGRGTRA